MSFEKNKEEEKSNKDQIFLGKKKESPIPYENLLNSENAILNQCNQCKICGNNSSKPYNSKESIKQINFKNLNNIKENENICPDCQNNEMIKKKELENSNIICYICGNKFPEKNIVYYNANKEQKNIFKNEFLNKNLTLDENEDNSQLTPKLCYIIKICNTCTNNNNEIIDKIFNKKLENEPIKQTNTNNNIIDELTNLISMEKGETNIFNILDSKSDNSADDNIKLNKNKSKDLFDTFVINKKENENIKKKQKQINIQNNNKKDDNLNIGNENNNNLFLKNINDNDLNKNESNIIIINENKNENLNNNENPLPENLNNNSFNLLEKNINSFLYMNQNNQNLPSININSNNKTSNIYIPHFFTTTPLTNNQNNNPIISNYNTSNNIPSNIIDTSNANNNFSSLNDINSNNIQGQVNTINNIKSSNSVHINPTNNNFNINIEENKNIIPFIPNMNQNNNYNYQNNCINTMNNLNEGINKLIGLNENRNINNIQTNIDDKDTKQDNLIDPFNNRVNDINKNINNNLIGLNYELKNTINIISKDLHSFDNSNIEKNINIFNNIQTLSSLFSKIITEQNKNQNINENNNNNIDIINILNNQRTANDFLNNINQENSKIEDKTNNNSNIIINNSEIDKEILKNMSLQELFNLNPIIKGLANYIISVNESLRSQLKTLKMYIEMQKIFISIIYQNIDTFIRSLYQNQVQSLSPVPPSQNKEPNTKNNFFSQIKDINTQNNQNNILSQITPPPLSLNTLNNLQPINPVNHSNKSLINSPNLNYGSPMMVSSISQFIQNNNLGRGLSLFNFPGQQFKQEFPSNMPNIFNGGPHLNIYPQQQGVSSVANPNFGQNMPQMLPILNQMNVNGNNNNINNNLQFSNNQKNSVKNN